ncbi:LacI family DNA-binding transcriptional regulator [Nesterenkonia sandarakina]|uniref:LacI family transcriptional regulator n=1 Tax=Nesterenkonia sandarakina TaxID=272918 RepID=A0A2T0YQR1_9MICC|nr:LacI family DNA-binding transcriptional regulator [Nesterenkonia sandarakina]PRZ17741.1 LacI family transcriptional regulator [Nesterenkonia sandarakina]
MAAQQHQVTLTEVARAAGVSTATASRAINGSSRRVSEDIAVRVKRIAEELGYLPNLSAQTVAKGASPTVAVLLSDIADPYFSAIAAGIMAGASEAALMVTMAASERSPARELQILRTFRSQRPQAIIVAGSRDEENTHAQEFTGQLRTYAETGGRVVVISQGPSPFDLVDIQNHDGARKLAHALVDRGGRHFGVVSGRVTLQTNADRIDGFRTGLAERGLTLTDDAIVETEFTRDGGYVGMHELLHRHKDLGAPLDTVFATSDMMAFGAATAIRDHGHSVGADISLAGFDNVGLTEDVNPAMTSVNVPLHELGRSAVRMALGSGREPVRLPISTQVVLRASTPQR